MNRFPIENIDKVESSENADLASKATQLATSREIILSGDASGSASFNGTDNASITVTVTDDSHNHTIANIDNLQTTLDDKAASAHSHAISDITNLQSSLDGKAASSHGTHVTFTTTVPAALGTASVGTATTVSRSDHVHPLPDIGAFPSGTKMLFHQSAAPTGWTKQTSINDSALRVVSGDTGGGTGGSVAFSTLFATGKTVSLSGNVGATTLTVAQMPSHSHTYSYGGVNYSGASSESSWGRVKSGSSNTGTTGSSSSHTHTLSGTASIALNVEYTDVIICSKN